MAIEDLLLLFLACGPATFPLGLVVLCCAASLAPLVTQIHRQL
jgi:hypothetical protein